MVDQFRLVDVNECQLIKRVLSLGSFVRSFISAGQFQFRWRITGVCQCFKHCWNPFFSRRSLWPKTSCYRVALNRSKWRIIFVNWFSFFRRSFRFNVNYRLKMAWREIGDEINLRPENETKRKKNGKMNSSADATGGKDETKMSTRNLI